jgi:NADPH2:quinone reductase
MPKTFVVREVGGPEVLRWEDCAVPEPGPGEARVRQTAVGLNFIDVYLRTGVYGSPLPFVPGQEGAGFVEAVGAGVSEVKPGDRVAYAAVPGGYAEVRVLPAARLVPLPPTIDDRTAAAIMLKGLTAEYLLWRCARVQPGDTILFHAAAGGVGSLACQWASARGVRVIGTAGGPDKVRRARANGCAEVIDYRSENIVERVKQLTAGIGVAAAFDSVGLDTFAASLDGLRPRGLLVLFGQSSGRVPPIDVLSLSAKGSLFVTRPVLAHYVATRAELLAASGALFDAVTTGAIKVEIGQTFPLGEAAMAHRALEARQTVGSTVLLP